MIGVTSNVRAFRRELDRQQKQANFAVALGLTRTAQDVKRDTERHIEQVFDRPTPFTKRGVFIRPARKSDARPTAIVGIKDKQAEYLSIQQEGGVEYPEGKAFVIPVKQRRNKYGNLPRRAVQRLLRKPNTFSGEVNGIGGIWQRTKRRGGRKLKLLIAYEQETRYSPIFGFYRNAREATIRVINRNMRRAVEEALRTRR